MPITALGQLKAYVIPAAKTEEYTHRLMKLPKASERLLLDVVNARATKINAFEYVTDLLAQRRHTENAIGGWERSELKSLIRDYGSFDIKNYHNSDAISIREVIEAIRDKRGVAEPKTAQAFFIQALQTDNELGNAMVDYVRSCVTEHKATEVFLDKNAEFRGEVENFYSGTYRLLDGALAGIDMVKIAHFLEFEKGLNIGSRNRTG